MTSPLTAVDRGLADSLRQGRTLPASWYTDAAVFELEREQIFRRNWVYAGLQSQVAEPGDFFTCRSGTMPLIVVRDDQGTVRAFANVCPHRGSEVVGEACGHRMSLQCPYHAWTFNLDGSLRRAPRAERNPLFDPEGIGLVELRAETIGPIIFVNADVEATPVADVLAGWYASLAAAGITLDPEIKIHQTHRYHVTANWKVIAENGLECYHCPANHPGLAAVKDVTRDFWWDEHAPYIRYGLPPTGEQDRAAAKDSHISCIWPLFFPTIRQGGLVVALIIEPVDVNHSVYYRQYWFTDEVDEAARQDLMEVIDGADREDSLLTPIVQAGMSSGFYDQGHLLLPATETGVRYFQGKVYDALVGGA